MTKLRRWEAAFWAVTGLFLIATALYYFSPQDDRSLVKAARFLSLEFEQNLATWWEGLCLLIVAVLAFERSLGPGPTWSWRGLALLAAALSLDELASIHERSTLLFERTGLDVRMSLLSLIIPAALLALATLAGFARAGERRRAILLGLALALLGSVVFQEKLEHTLTWPSWSAPWRGVVEEGTEVLGVFLLLKIVLEPGATAAVIPRPAALRRLWPVAIAIAAVGTPVLLYVGHVTRSMRRGHGIPMAWIPSVLLALVGLAALAAAREGQGRRVLLAFAAAAFLFSLDEVAILPKGQKARPFRSPLQVYALPVLGGLALLVPRLRTRANALLLAGAFVGGLPIMLMPSRVVPWLVAPAQALCLYFVMRTGLSDDDGASRGN